MPQTSAFTYSFRNIEALLETVPTASEAAVKTDGDRGCHSFTVKPRKVPRQGFRESFPQVIIAAF